MLEHPPVYTKGRRTEPRRPADGRGLVPRPQGIEVCDTDRGGRVTYHGPGQLVAYPIMAVERVADFVHTMERAIVAALADEGIEAEVRDDTVHRASGSGRARRSPRSACASRAA